MGNIYIIFAYKKKMQMQTHPNTYTNMQNKIPFELQNQFPVHFFHNFPENTESLIRNSLIRNRNWDSELTDLAFQNNQIILAQGTENRDIISDSEFIEIIHHAISKHDIDPIQFFFTILNPDMVTQIYIYQLISIQP